MIGIAAAAALTAAAAMLAWRAFGSHGAQPTPSPAMASVATSAPATAPSHHATTSAARAPEAALPAETTLFDVIRDEHPSLPTTQPLAVPIELNQSARVILRDPIYLSSARGDLWITRDRAAPTEQVMKEAIDPNTRDPQSHVLRERVQFVHWMPSDAGPWLPYLICLGPGAQSIVVSAEGRHPLPHVRAYRWDHAFSWNERVVVPSATGVSVLTLSPSISESYQELMPSTAAAASSPQGDGPVPQVLLDWQGILAWVPWEGGRPGSRGAARFVKDHWMDLDAAAGWPERTVHLVPLRDGSVIQFVLRDDGTIHVQMTALDRAPVDDQAIKALVDQLADVDQEVRRKALSELSSFGPGAWPILQKLMSDEPPQAQLLLRQLLRDQTHPTLGGMTPLGAQDLQLAARLSDGGAVFYAEQGVQVPEADGDPTTVAPAWLSVRPGHYIQLLPPALVADLKPGQSRLDVVGDQWIAATDVRGPRLFFGNGFTTLLRKDERAFGRVVGMDQLGRWLFRRPDASNAADAAETLIIDPHLPDLVPRLPVWQLAIAQSVGWDKDGWPAVKNGSAFALSDTGWRAMEKDERMFTGSDGPLPSADGAAPALSSPPSTAPATRPATRPATAPAEPPILVLKDGTRYFGGVSSLSMIDPNGRRVDWPLPAAANGTGPVTLIRAPDGKLFLFNQSGRVLRIGPGPAGKDAEPFRLEATFTHDIPNAAHPTRIWLDPAGRIDIEWQDRLALLFPEGYIPRAITEMMVDQPGEP